MSDIKSEFQSSFINLYNISDDKRIKINKLYDFVLYSTIFNKPVKILPQDKVFQVIAWNGENMLGIPLGNLNNLMIYLGIFNRKDQKVKEVVRDGVTWISIPRALFVHINVRPKIKLTYKDHVTPFRINQEKKKIVRTCPREGIFRFCNGNFSPYLEQEDIYEVVYFDTTWKHIERPYSKWFTQWFGVWHSNNVKFEDINEIGKYIYEKL
jgi:hypothetical protein